MSIVQVFGIVLIMCLTDAGLRDLLVTMEKSSQPIPPIVFLQVLHMAYPQFSEKSEHGGFQQQVCSSLSVTITK